jgi:hypothetical protein
MTVAVDHPGDDRGSGRVDHLDLGADLLLPVGGSNPDHPVAFDEDADTDA